MSWPDIHGDKVVFTAEGDLWLGDVKTLDAKRITSDAGVEDQARFSPDGTEIAFEGQYDGYYGVYRMKLDSEPPERLTYDVHPTAFLDGYSQDGKRLLVGYPTPSPFVASLAWLDIATHALKPLPFEMASYSSLGPNDELALTRVEQTWQTWFGYHGGQANPIWFGNLPTMKFRKIYSSQGSNEYPVIAGGRIYFCQDDNGAFEIRSVNKDGSDPRLNAGPYNVPLQHLHGDGHRLVYMKGPGLEMLDLSTGKTQPLFFHLASDQPHSRPFLAPAEAFVQDMNIAPDGKRVLVESRGQIVSIPVKDGAARIILATPGVRYRKAVLSPDKKQLAYVSDQSGEEQIYVSDADGHNPIPWTRDRNRQITELRWSPNGKYLTYSDSTIQTYVLTQESKWPLKVTHGPFMLTPSYDISPDGSWIVVEQEHPHTRFSSLVLIEVATRKATPIDLGLMSATVPCFSRNGRWIGFLGDQDLSPDWDPTLNQMNSGAKARPFLLALMDGDKSPLLTKSDEDEDASGAGKGTKESKPDDKKPSFKVDLEGLNQRLITVPAPADVYGEIQIVGDRVLLVSNTSLKYYDLKAKSFGTTTALAPFPVVPGWHARLIHLSSDGSKILAFGPKPRVIAATDEEQKPDVGAIHFGQLKINVAAREEWSEIFEDVWRTIRDNFYAENLHGVNWPAMRTKYKALIPLVRSRSDLDYVIKWLSAEVNTGHMYTDYASPFLTSQTAKPAYLGIDLISDSGFLKITRIYRGNGYVKPSPLAAQGLGVKEGDYLIEVAGVPAVDGTDISLGMRGRAGNPIEIKLNSKPMADGARTILVEPLDSDIDLRYYDWVDKNRRYVDRKSGGKLGYIHLDAMTKSTFADFIRQYLPQSAKEGIVIDIRFNGGGNLAGPLTSILSRKVLMWGHLRNAPDYPGRDQRAFLGHLACLVNEHSYS